MLTKSKSEFVLDPLIADGQLVTFANVRKNRMAIILPVVCWSVLLAVGVALMR